MIARQLETAEDEYTRFAKNVYRLTNINLELYKRQQMERRIMSLRDKNGYKDYHSYYLALASNKGLLLDFLDRMTINVTEFFRNPERWKVVGTHLKSLAKESKTLNVWSAACSTGEEPYTLSIILKENSLKPFTILATDLDAIVLEKAKKGTYVEGQLKSMPDSFKEKYFDSTPSLSDVHVKAEIKRPVTFKQHNLLHDRYPTGLDLIVCRNVMIYFTDEAKNTIFKGFAKSLKSGGLLLIGNTERVLNPGELGLVQIENQLYKKL